MTKTALKTLIAEMFMEDGASEGDFYTLLAQRIFHTETPTDEQRTAAQGTAFRILYSGPLPSTGTEKVSA